MSDNWSGSPVGPFDLYKGVTFAAGANQILIAAPGVGQSIYLQTLTVGCGGGAAGRAVFHDGGGNFLTELACPAVNSQCNVISFPGGLQLVANTTLQCDVTGGNIDILMTYTTGPSAV